MNHELQNIKFKNHITVVMPCYNHAQYVERAVLSVVCQTYANFDLVVIDDGSKDESVEKLKELQKKHLFTLITQENKGVCKTLNRAIREAASGEYVALLASDDFWHEDKLKLQMEILGQHPESEFCFSQAIEFTDETNPSNGRLFPKKCLSGQVLNSVFLRQHVPAGTMLFSRHLYDRLGGFDENLKEEDWDFVIRSAAATSFCSVSKPLLYYRSNAANTMKTRKRTSIFHQKVIILTKNFNMVSPFRWYFSVSIHFFYDLILKK
jgi:alpha-1,3-rhamnosyltransferase